MDVMLNIFSILLLLNATTFAQAESGCTNNCVSTPGWTIDSNPVTTCGWMEHICGPMRRGECLEHGGNVKCQWGYVTGNHWANYGPYGSPVSHCCNCKGFQMPENYADSYWTTAPASWVWNGNWKNTHTSTGTELPICDPTDAPTETPTTNQISPVFEVSADETFTTDLIQGLEGSVTGSIDVVTHNGLNAVYISGDNNYIEWDLDVGPSSMPQLTLEVLVWIPSIANNRGWIFGDENGGCDRYILLHDDRAGGFGPSCKFNPGLGNVPTGEWVHLITTYDQVTGATGAYMNGHGNSRTSGVTHDDGRRKLRIGSPWPNHYGEMYIAEARAYGSVLSLRNIEARYAAAQNKVQASMGQNGCTDNCVSTPGWTIDSNPVTTCGWMEHICGPMRRGECLEHGGDVKCQWGYVTSNHWANYGPYGSPVSHCCNCKGFQMPENYADGYWTTAPASWVWNGNWKNTHTSTGTELPICDPTNAPTETPTPSPVDVCTLGTMTAGGVGDRSAELDRKYFKFDDQTAYDDYTSAGSQYWHNGLGRTTYVSQTSLWPEGCMNACCANPACQSFMLYKSECILYSVGTSGGMDDILGHSSRQGPWGINAGGPGYSIAFWTMSRQPSPSRRNLTGRLLSEASIN